MRLKEVEELVGTKRKQDRVCEFIEQTLSSAVGKKVQVKMGGKYKRGKDGKPWLIDGIND